MSDNRIDLFFGSELASAFLWMPFCLEAVANPAHKHIFGNADIRVPGSSGEISDILEHQQPVLPVNRLCYCDKIGAALALSNDDCAVEQADSNLKYNFSGWVPSIQFRLENQDGCRKYSADCIFARKTGRKERASSTYSVNQKWHLLEMRRAGLKAIEVLITTKYEGELSPRLLSGSVNLYGNAWMDPIESPIPFNTAYRTLDHQLEMAVADLTIHNIRDVEKRVLNALSQLHNIEYVPIDAFIRSEFAVGYNGDVTLLQKRLLLIRERIFDAPFLMKYVLPAIESNLDVDFQPVSATVSSEEFMKMGRDSGSKDLEPDDPAFPEIESSRLRKELSLVAFKRLLPGLLKTVPNEFVAIVDGNVIDNDVDSVQLATRMLTRHKPTAILIRKVVSVDEESSILEFEDRPRLEDDE